MTITATENRAMKVREGWIGIRNASQSKELVTYGAIGAACGVNRETVRNFIRGDGITSISVKTLMALEEGLKKFS